MVALRTVILSVMDKLGSQRSLISTYDAERWLTEAFTIAALKRSSRMTIRLCKDGVEGMIYDQGADSCTGQMRLLEPVHFDALLSILQKRTGCMNPVDHEIHRGHGRCTQTINGLCITIDVYMNANHASPQLDLHLRYEPS